MEALVKPQRQMVRLRGRSYVAFVFVPTVPILDWLQEIDATIARSPGFFAGTPVVIDLSSVGSGAEVVAGGSIHIYGALRGRAMAGVNGHTSARIYCQKIEAELLAIDGFYQTADDIDAALRGKPAQAWLQGNTMRITALN